MAADSQPTGPTHGRHVGRAIRETIDQYHTESNTFQKKETPLQATVQSGTLTPPYCCEGKPKGGSVQEPKAEATGFASLDSELEKERNISIQQ